MARLREKTGATAHDPRLIGVQLDLVEPRSVSQATAEIERAVGAPYGLVYNAGVAAAGMVEESPIALWMNMFQTNILGPVAFTQALLPPMRPARRAAGSCWVSSQSGLRGMPGTAPYSAVKASLERWGESMASEISPFGIGVSVLIAGTYATEIITDAPTSDCRVLDGTYAAQHRMMDKRGRSAVRYLARPPEVFAAGLAVALNSTKPFDRRALGPNARMLMLTTRLLSPSALHHILQLALGIARQTAKPGQSEPGDGDSVNSR